MSTYSIGHLNCLRSFLQRECNWFRVCKQPLYQEYRCVSTSSPVFIYKNKRNAKKCLCCEMVILKKDGKYAFSLAINGIHYGQFISDYIKMRKQKVLTSIVYYIAEIKTISVIDLGFIPLYDYASQLEKSEMITPHIFYEACTLVSAEEAVNVCKTNGDCKLVPLGGCGAWCIRDGNEVSIYTFCLNYDLFLACYDKETFPSLAKLIFDTIKCKQDDCIYCQAHDVHVDQSGQSCLRIVNTETCFCYSPCRQSRATVSNFDLTPLISDEPIDHLDILPLKKSQFLSLDMNHYVHGYDGDKPIVLKTGNMMLVRLNPELSRLVLLSCPILKNLAFE